MPEINNERQGTEDTQAGVTHKEQIERNEDAPSKESGLLSNDPTERNATAAEQRQKQFEVTQEAERKRFERDSEAAKREADRNQQLAAAKAERDDKLTKRRAELHTMGLEHGFINDADIEARQARLAPLQDCMSPHDALRPGENTVLMAFPHDVVLTLSAHDMRAMHGLSDDDLPEGTGVVTHGARVLFQKGLQDVPESISDYPWLADHGAYRVSDDGKPETPEEREQRINGKRAKDERAEERKDQDKSKRSARDDS
jgi:hypothetical protein